MKKIYLTGASGFIGSHLTTYFENKGITVEAIDVRAKDWEKCNYSADALIHLAAVASDNLPEADTHLYQEVNVALTQKVYDVFLKNDLTNFVFLSSIKACGEYFDSPATETQEPKPVSHYGISKHAAEHYILANEANPKRSFILRPSLVYGTGNRGNLLSLYKLVKMGIPWPFGFIENKKNFCYIQNLMYCMEGLLRSEAPSGVYHIADDETISTQEILTFAAMAQNKKPRIVDCCKGLFIRIFQLGSWLRLPINQNVYRKLSSNLCVSNEKVKSALRIDHMPFSVTVGMHEMFSHLADDQTL